MHCAEKKWRHFLLSCFLFVFSILATFVVINSLGNNDTYITKTEEQVFKLTYDVYDEKGKTKLSSFTLSSDEMELGNSYTLPVQTDSEGREFLGYYKFTKDTDLRSLYIANSNLITDKLVTTYDYNYKLTKNDTYKVIPVFNHEGEKRNVTVYSQKNKTNIVYMFQYTVSKDKALYFNTYDSYRSVGNDSIPYSTMYSGDPLDSTIEVMSSGFTIGRNNYKDCIFYTNSSSTISQKVENSDNLTINFYDTDGETILYTKILEKKDEEQTYVYDGPNYSNNPIIGFEYELNHHGGILVSNDKTVSAKRSTMNFVIPSGITGNMNVFAVRENNGYYFYPQTNLTLMDKSYVQPGEDITFYASTSNIDNVSYIAKLIFIPSMSSRHDSQSLYANSYNPCLLEEEIILYKTDRNVSLNGENKIAFTYTVKDEDFLFKNQAIYVKLEYFVSRNGSCPENLKIKLTIDANLESLQKLIDDNPLYSDKYEILDEDFKTVINTSITVGYSFSWDYYSKEFLFRRNKIKPASLFRIIGYSRSPQVGELEYYPCVEGYDTFGYTFYGDTYFDYSLVDKYQKLDFTFYAIYDFALTNTDLARNVTIDTNINGISSDIVITDLEDNVLTSAKVGTPVKFKLDYYDAIIPESVLFDIAYTNSDLEEGFNQIKWVDDSHTSFYLPYIYNPEFIFYGDTKVTFNVTLKNYKTKDYKINYTIVFKDADGTKYGPEGKLKDEFYDILPKTYNFDNLNKKILDTSSDLNYSIFKNSFLLDDYLYEHGWRYGSISCTSDISKEYGTYNVPLNLSFSLTNNYVPQLILKDAIDLDVTITMAKIVHSIYITTDEGCDFSFEGLRTYSSLNKKYVQVEEGKEYIVNLITKPGYKDLTYEFSSNKINWDNPRLDENNKIVIPYFNLNNYLYLNLSTTPIDYSISYELENGVINPNEQTTYQVTDSFSLLNATHDGFIFEGWKYTLNDEEHFEKEPTIPQGSKEDLTFKAVFSRTITLSISDPYDMLSNKNSLPLILDYYSTYDFDFVLSNEYEYSYRLSTKSNHDIFNFVNTKTNKINSFSFDDKSMLESTDDIIYLFINKGKPINYSLNYEYDSSWTFDKKIKSTYSIEDDSYQLIPNTRPGYIFNGWLINDSTEPVTSIDLCSYHQDLNLRLDYSLIEYEIKFMNGETVLSSNKYTILDEVVVPTDVTKDSTKEFTYEFNGWDKEVEVHPTKDNVYNAVFNKSKNKYNVVISIDGDTKENRSLAYGDNLPNYIPNEVDGYKTTFIKWVDQDNNEVTKVTGDMVISPIINKELINYSIVYELNGGNVYEDNPTSYNIETETFTINNPIKEGYEFIGWLYNELNYPEVTINKGTTGDIKLVASYKEIVVEKEGQILVRKISSLSEDDAQIDKIIKSNDSVSYYNVYAEGKVVIRDPIKIKLEMNDQNGNTIYSVYYFNKDNGELEKVNSNVDSNGCINFEIEDLGDIVIATSYVENIDLKTPIYYLYGFALFELVPTLFILFKVLKTNRLFKAKKGA